MFEFLEVELIKKANNKYLMNFIKSNFDARGNFKYVIIMC